MFQIKRVHRGYRCNALVQVLEGDGLGLCRVLYYLGQDIAIRRNSICFSEHRFASLFGCHFDRMTVRDANANRIPDIPLQARKRSRTGCGSHQTRRLTRQGGEAFLGVRDGVGGRRIVGRSRCGFVIRLEGFVLLAEFLVRLPEQTLDEGVVLIGF